MIVKSYAELEEYIKMFKNQTSDLLIIMSRAGLGKTTTLKKVMGKENFVYINTHSSPLKTYINLFEHCDEPVCYDKETEVLTENGWKFFSDLNQKDFVATINQDTLKLEYQKPTEIIKKHYNGEMINIKSKRVDLCVTPNHKLFARNKYVKSDKNKFHLIKAKEIYKNDKYEFLKVANWSGKKIKYFYLPSHKVEWVAGRGGKISKIYEIKKIPIEPWLKFFGFWLAEGCVKYRNKRTNPTTVSVSNKDKKILKDIKKIITECGFTYGESIRKDGFCELLIHNSQLAKHLSQFGKDKERYIPKEIKELDKKLLSELYDYMYMGDGYKGKDSFYLSTCSKRLAEDITEILLKMGEGAKVSTVLPNKQNKQTCPLYRINRDSKGRDFTTPQIRKKFWSRYKYNDFVYCCVVKNHTLFVRRKGISVFSGNCFDDINILLKNQIMVSMLKSLADTSPIKELHYNTTSKLIGNAPENFKTTSNVCILLNEFDAKNKDLAPLIDRGFLVEFSPSKKEILKKIEKINKSGSMADLKKCVYDFIKENYQKIEKLSVRTYIKATQLFRDNPDKWKERFMQMIGFDEKLIEYLKLKEKYKTDKEMIKKFSWGRSTFYRIKQEAEE